MFPTVINSSIFANNDRVDVENSQTMSDTSKSGGFGRKNCPKKLLALFFTYFRRFTRLWGVFTAIVLCGIGIDLVFHRHKNGYYFIGGSAVLLFLEVTWAITLFLQLCVRSETRVFRIWSAVAWLEEWKKSVVYAPLGALPLVWPHKLWLSYVAAGQLFALSLFHLVLTFKERSRRKRHNRLLHADIDSFESSKFEEVLDDALPEPIAGGSHSLCDSLNGQEAVLEI